MDSLLSKTASDLISELRAKKLSIGFAESCTGGLLSATVAAIPGVSDVFMGSVVSYAYQAKADLLGVSWEALNAEGAVSQIVAEQMAKGLKKQLKTDCSIAITGIAGPTGGTPEKPVGTVWFAVSGPGFDSAQKKQFSGDRVQIQKQSVQFAIELLREKLKRA